jgi:hypothetical protein
VSSSNADCHHLPPIQDYKSVTVKKNVLAGAKGVWIAE